jgi:DNA-binding MarR family transcriptional regulator
VDDLQRLGYVERIPDPTDGRAKLVRLTVKGEEARQLGRDIFADIERRWAKELGEERWENARRALEDLYVILGERIAIPA